MSADAGAAASSGGDGTMSLDDLNLCKAALGSLTSKTNAKKNYLFLEPVNLQLLPTYAEVVKRPMDLGTVKKKLEGEGDAVYRTRDEFWADVDQVFTNACVFHGPIKENEWIVKLAKQMQKIAEREKKKAEKKVASAGKGAGIVSGATLKKKRGRPPKVKTEDGSGAAGKAKPSVKLKLSAPKAVVSAIEASQNAAAAAADTAGTSSAPAPSQAKGRGKKETAVKAKPSKPKISLKLSLGDGGGGGGSSAKSAGSAASRGKALPTDISPAEKVKTKARNKPGPKPKLKLSISESASGSGKARGRPPGSSNKTAAPLSSGMTLSEVAQCSKALSALRRRNPTESTKWFNKPVSDPQIVDDYRAKVPHPVDFGTISSKLEKGEYADIASFVLDVRRVFANCLRYNTTIQDSFRPLARDMLMSAEQIFARFIATPAAYPRLLYCWKLTLSLLDTLLNMTNPSDGFQTAHYFLHPVSYYVGGAFPPDYLAVIKTPMDFGTITSNLFEGTYQTVSEFVTDCKLVVDNCRTYYAGREDGLLFIELADRLDGLMVQQLNALVRYDNSGTGAREKASPVAPLYIPRPSQDFLMSILAEVREMEYTSKFTKIAEPATLPFEQPVNVALFPDYPKYVQMPMDLSTVESKVKSGAYETAEDFEFDINLIFRNCEAYNGPKKNTHIVAMAKYCSKTFRKLYSKRMAALLESGDAESAPVATSSSSGEKKRSISPASGAGAANDARPPKKIKLDLSAVRTAPRISITAAQLASSASREKNPKPRASTPTSTPDEPVPLHVAIAQIKESFPLRRPAKLLEGWESSCWRFFRELMKHPWLSAARPKYVFHVPVHVLFPSIREAYAAKIKKPMDLTTAEAKLLSGGVYLGPQDFVNDVALVFANGITFNREGRDEGEPLSCAYFDASKHLLRYARWLSLEYLDKYLAQDEHTDVPTPDDGLVTTWKLTTANKKLARDEMETIALKSQMDISEEGDRFTYMETECEKLLKSLRHQSDAKYMYFFIQSIYPPDYSAFISKPMSWDQCNDTLQNRQYETIGELVDDLRLIFSNALKYNARGKGTETISGKAYDSAVHMSARLETAIDRMTISVSNRLETDKVEQVIAERELEAEERAEEERLRKAWQQETENAKHAKGTVTTTVEKIRIIQRRPTRKALDFDFPFNDDDEGSQDASHIDALRQQKLIFESQRADRVKMFKTSIALGGSMYSRMFEQSKAAAWAKKKAAEAAKTKGTIPSSYTKSSDGSTSTNTCSVNAQTTSSVGDKVDKDREQINKELKAALGRLKLSKKKKKKKKKSKTEAKPVIFD